MNKLVVSLFILFVLAACSNGSSASIQGQWKLTSYSFDSSQMPAAPGVETSIEFDSDGRMSGNVGCNGFGGDYIVNGDTITFKSVMATLMFCEGPVGEQELGTLTVLKDSAKFVLDGNKMIITSADRNSVIVLERK